MVVVAYFITLSLIGSPGVIVPQWVAPAVAGTGIVIVILGVGVFTWTVAVTRSNPRRAGLSADLIADFDRYPVRELSRRFDSSAKGH